MKVGVVKEKNSLETRVAISPVTAKQLADLGLQVTMQSKAGEKSSFTDEMYNQAGVTLIDDAAKILKSSDIILKVGAPTVAEIGQMKKGAVVIGMLATTKNPENSVKKYASSKVSAIAMELIPRISRAQNMDVLSSQSNLAGYKAVIDGVAAYGKVIPMMVTAAGTIKPAKILILGAGVAGLQAIATAKRLGAIVSVFDVRPEVEEQVNSLGANFIKVMDVEQESAQGAGGYAKEMSAEYKKKQSALIAEHVKLNDIIVTTALIPGKPAPTLITDKMLKSMKANSIIVDLAAANGGNCSGTQVNKVVVKHGTTIIGHENLACSLASDASMLYAQNLFHLTKSIINTKLKRVKINFEDEIIQASLLTHDGKIVHPLFKKDKQG